MNATKETDPDILRRMIEIERDQAAETQASLSNELDRLRAEVERLEAVQSSCHRDIIRIDADNDRLQAENAELDRLRAELAELNSPSALGNLLKECRRLRSALDAIRRHSGKDTDAHQLALEALEAAAP